MVISVSQVLTAALQVLMALIEDHQAVEDEEGQEVIEDWKAEVHIVRQSLSASFPMYNPLVFHCYTIFRCVVSRTL